MTCVKCLKISNDLDEKLIELEFETEHILIRTEKAVVYCTSALIEMRDYVIQHGFNNEQDEIEFFKVIKPKVYSKLLFNTQIFLIESKRPKNSNKIQRKYLIAEMSKIQIYTNDNLEFYQYYRRNTTKMDHHFFLRCNADFRIFLSNIHYLIDKQFCTSHDQTVGFIHAYDKLYIYLIKELGKLNTKYRESEILEMEENVFNYKLFWTESKIALVELIYAVYSTGAVNSGVTDIKVLKEVFEKIFHIELGDLYHSFTEMRMRKKDRTKFLDYLKARLLNRMDKTDDQK